MVLYDFENYYRTIVKLVEFMVLVKFVISVCFFVNREVVG